MTRSVVALVPLQTDRLRLRALDLGDLDGVFAILGHNPTTENVSWGLDTLDDAAEWLRCRSHDESELGYSMWAVELGIQPEPGTESESDPGAPRLIGLCGFFETEEPDQVELGYVIHADYWGDGLGTEAAQAAIDAARTNGLNIIATIRTTNQASIKVAQRIGLLQTGERQDDRGTLLVWTQAATETTSLDTAGSDTADELLGGGWQTEVHRRGKTVLRTTGPQSQTVIRLLHHLADKRFDAAPAPIGTGFANDGREHLTFIEGASPQPLAWSDEAAWHIGDLLRQLHSATSDFDPGPVSVWAPWFARSLSGTHPVIGHGDLGPWNIIARDGLPVAFIDWDNAGPVDAAWELAQVTWLNAQLHDDDVAALNELPPAAARIQQARVILDGYGLPKSEREGFVDKMIEFAILTARDEAVIHSVGPDTTSPAADGFPTLWGITWRTRAAAWMIDHRQAIDATLRN